MLKSNVKNLVKNPFYSLISNITKPFVNSNLKGKKDSEIFLFWLIIFILSIIILIASIWVCYRQRRNYIEEENDNEDESLDSYSRFN